MEQEIKDILYKVTIDCIKKTTEGNAFLPQETYYGLTYTDVLQTVSYFLLKKDLSTQITWSIYEEGE